MTQLELPLFDWRRAIAFMRAVVLLWAARLQRKRVYHVGYYWREHGRRLAQKQASLHGGHWRNYSPGWA